MVRKQLRVALALLGAATLTLPPTGARAEQLADFYRGKNINFIIGSGQAGVYDQGARLMARYLPRFIPGHPALVPQNMPGASSVRAASFIYNLAPRDGLTIGTAQPTIVLNKLLDPAVQYEPQNFSWIGRLQPMTLVGLAWTGAPHHTMAQARTQPLVVGASGASGTSAIVPWALNRLAGTKFHVVLGYESETPQLLAMERGELDGVGSAGLSDVLAKDAWIKNKKVNFLYTIAARRSAELPDVPAIVEFGDNALDRAVLESLGSVTDIGFTMMAPPDIPADRATALRAAFAAMVKDPDFRAEARKIRLAPEPLSGPALHALVASIFNASAAAVTKLRQVVQPPQ